MAEKRPKIDHFFTLFLLWRNGDFRPFFGRFYFKNHCNCILTFLVNLSSNFLLPISRGLSTWVLMVEVVEAMDLLDLQVEVEVVVVGALQL